MPYRVREGPALLLANYLLSYINDSDSGDTPVTIIADGYSAAETYYPTAMILTVGARRGCAMSGFSGYGDRLEGTPLAVSLRFFACHIQCGSVLLITRHQNEKDGWLLNIQR